MVCPFCKEEIRDEAIKCRYCGSSLLPPQVQAPAPASLGADGKQTVYVLDQGLIRFGKFVAAILAIFIAIGVYLYGIDVKESLKLIDSSKDEVKKSSDDVKKSSDEVQKSSEDIEASSKEVTKARGDVEKVEEQVTQDQVQTSALIKASNEKLSTMDRQMATMTEKQQQTSAVASRVQGIETSMQQQMAAQQQQFKVLLAQAESKTQTITEFADKAAAGYRAIASGGAGEAVKSESPGTPSAIPMPAAPTEAGNAGTAITAIPAQSYTPVELAKLYNFPKNLSGAGQTIALIELGGGYRDKQINDYFTKLGMAHPKLTSVFVDGGKNTPTTAASADGEVQPDIEIVGAIAPKANIVVYFTVNTDQGFLHAIQKAIDNESPRTTVLSISWGGPESSWTKAAMESMNDALEAAGRRNITVLVAAGDDGTADGVKDGKKHVDFMASSPWVTAVGGTRIVNGAGGGVTELLWDDSSTNSGAAGYGVSRVFPVPDYQTAVNAPATDEGFRGRALPDVSADASPRTGYVVSVDGNSTVVGGTALAAPLWAGLVALLNEGVGHNLGFLNPQLYQRLGPGLSLRPVPTPAAGQRTGHWSAQTGWGSPDGEKLLNALRR